jgi:hypothetical protein
MMANDGGMKACSFCGKASSGDRGLVISKLKRSAKICSDCLKICRETLKGDEVRQKSGVYRCASSERIPRGSMCCSFCGHSMKVAGKLLSSPLDDARCYICPRCVRAEMQSRSQPANRSGPGLSG